MKVETALYEYLYQLLRYQFYNGSLRRGQKFPSQSELCRQYNVGITTARRVIHMLEEDGFIKTHERKRPTVIYQVDNHTYITAIIQNKQTILDIFDGFELILPALQFEGARRCRSLGPLEAIISNISGSTEPRALYHLASCFMLELLVPCNNQIMYDLQTDSENFTFVPYLPMSGLEDQFSMTHGEVRSILSCILEAIRTQNRQLLHSYIYGLYRGGRDHDERYIKALELHCNKDVKMQEIQNFMVKTRASLFTVIARKLYRRILDGEFDNCKYIPSVPDLMKEYSVSQATALKAVELLNDIGAIQTIDKKGSVIAEPGAPLLPLRLDKITIEKNLVLFMDAMQILAICSENLARSFLTGMDGGAAAKAARDLDRPGINGFGIVIRTLLEFFKENTPYRSLYNLFEQLDHHLIWGHYMERNTSPIKAANDMAAELFVSLRSALAEKDVDRFSRCARRIFYHAYGLSRQMMIDYGTAVDLLPAALDEDGNINI